MANTLNLGNSKWATKNGSLLGYNSENDNFKPLPFTVTRASASSRINKLGLIENVTNNIATIDYQGNVNGALLTQPQSTNLITYPVSFGNSYWTKSGATIEADASTAGAEVIVNGDFATDTDWVKGSSWTIGGGLATSNGTSSYLEQSSVLVVGKTYEITFDLSNYVSGTLWLHSTKYESSSQYTSNGTYTLQIIPKLTGFYFYSTSFNGSIDNVSVKEVQGFTSPSADYTTSAYKLVESSANEQHRLDRSGLTVSSGADVTCSIFAKKGERNWIILYEAESGKGYYFDLVNGVKGTHFIAAPESYSIEAVGSYWKISITSAVPSTSARFIVYNAKQDGEISYQGDGTSGVYIYGSQLEQLSYPTSLIYNGVEGSTVTRVADQVSQTGLSGIINSVEGVLYSEIAALDNGTSTRSLTLSDGTLNNRLTIRFPGADNVIGWLIVTGGVVQNSLNTTTTNILLQNKVALKWKLNDVALWINGVEVTSDITINVPSTNILNSLRFDDGSGGSDFYGKTSDLKIYNAILTDSELQTLTTI